MLSDDLASSETQVRSQPDEDDDRCQHCFTRGIKSRVRKFQINSEECVSICSSEKCISNTSSSSLILKRKASEIPNLRRRRRKSSLPAHVGLSDWPKSSVTLLWRNKQALCWLDSSLLMMVFCRSLRKCLRLSNDDLSLKRLCETFDDAQTKLESNIPNRGIVSDSSSIPNDYNGNSDDIFTNFGDSLELLQVCEANSTCSIQEDLSSLISMEVLVTKGEQNSKKDELGSEEEDLSQPLALLDKERERIWEQMEPDLRCRKGEEESPVFALPVILRKNLHLEAHFRSTFHWQFYCSRCHYVDISQEKRVVLSLKTLNRSLSPVSYYSQRQCPSCQSPQERTSLVIHKLPACPMFHFVEGLPQLASWEQLEFHHSNFDYKVAAIIQYKQNPKHFVTWIRDSQRNLWLEGDDLKKSVVRWCEEEPKFPPSEAHIVMWERQGRCSGCQEEQSLVQNIMVADENGLKDILQRDSDPIDGEENVRSVNYLEAYIPKGTKDLSNVRANSPNAKRTDTELQRTTSSSRARRKNTDLSVQRRAGFAVVGRFKTLNKNPKRRKTLIGQSLATKFAAFSESLQSFVEFKEMMAERKRRSNKCLPRAVRSGSISPLCSPSGSSESSSLPDNNQNLFPDLELILEDFRQNKNKMQKTKMPHIASDLECFLQDL